MLVRGVKLAPDTGLGRGDAGEIVVQVRRPLPKLAGQFPELFGQLVSRIVGLVALRLEVAGNLLDALGLAVGLLADPLVRGNDVVLWVGDEQHRRERQRGAGTSSESQFANMRGSISHMDPEVLLQIAIMYENLGQDSNAKAYMELCIAQETGASSAEVSSNSNNNNNTSAATSTLGGDPDLAAAATPQDDPDGEQVEGTGVTVATSTARKWLAKYAMQHGDYAMANTLAGELCQDGVEIEDAKALIREVRSRMDAMDG